MDWARKFAVCRTTSAKPETGRCTVLVWGDMGQTNLRRLASVKVVQWRERTGRHRLTDAWSCGGEVGIVEFCDIVFWRSYVSSE